MTGNYLKEKNFYNNLIEICESIANGNYEYAKQLFEMTNFNNYPKPIARLAESFGLMLVKVEAREFHLETIIDQLRQTQQDLIKAHQQLKDENAELKQKLHQKFSFQNIIGKSKAVLNIIEKIKKTANTPFPVLLTGETGTGKEVIANAFHYSSIRANHPFIAINCSALPKDLIEAELFGIEKGVATGVDKREGKLVLAKKGTIFLDEIGDLNLSNQAKLLRALEEKKITPIGGKRPIPVQARIIAATNKNLEKEIKKGSFREDLFYRLNVIHIHIPPLRERPDDIPLLIKFFLENTCKQLGLKVKNLTPQAKQALLNYSWPGNVRELKNEIERAIVLSDTETIDVKDLSEKITISQENSNPLQLMSHHNNLTLKEAEKILIQQVLESTQGNKTEAAKRLGISREGLRKKMKRLGIKLLND